MTQRKTLILALVCVASATHFAVQAQAPGAPGGEAPAAPAAPVAVTGKPIFISSQMPYAEGALIDQNVRSECQLPTQGAELLETAARAAGLNLVRNDDGVKAGKGQTFRVEIISVVSAGNAFIGHRKQVTVRGRLMDGDKEVAVFQQARDSMGGAFAGFKGSCSVLGRCLDALSRDMTTWLKSRQSM